MNYEHLEFVCLHEITEPQFRKIIEAFEDLQDPHRDCKFYDIEGEEHFGRIIRVQSVRGIANMYRVTYYVMVAQTQRHAHVLVKEQH